MLKWLLPKIFPCKCVFHTKAFTNERGKSILEQLNCPCFEVPEHIYQKSAILNLHRINVDFTYTKS